MREKGFKKIKNITSMDTLRAAAQQTERVSSTSDHVKMSLMLGSDYKNFLSVKMFTMSDEAIIES